MVFCIYYLLAIFRQPLRDSSTNNSKTKRVRYFWWRVPSLPYHSTSFFDMIDRSWLLIAQSLLKFEPFPENTVFYRASLDEKFQLCCLHCRLQDTVSKMLVVRYVEIMSVIYQFICSSGISILGVYQPFICRLWSVYLQSIIIRDQGAIIKVSYQSECLVII